MFIDNYGLSVNHILLFGILIVIAISIVAASPSVHAKLRIYFLRADPSNI